MAKAGLGLSFLRAQRLFAGGMSFQLSSNAQAKTSPSSPFSESDDALLEKYLNGDAVSADELGKALP